MGEVVSDVSDVNTKGLITRLIRRDLIPLTQSLRNFYKNANAVLFKRHQLFLTFNKVIVIISFYWNIR